MNMFTDFFKPFTGYVNHEVPAWNADDEDDENIPPSIFRKIWRAAVYGVSRPVVWSDKAMAKIFGKYPWYAMKVATWARLFGQWYILKSLLVIFGMKDLKATVKGYLQSFYSSWWALWNDDQLAAPTGKGFGYGIKPGSFLDKSFDRDAFLVCLDENDKRIHKKYSVHFFTYMAGPFLPFLTLFSSSFTNKWQENICDNEDKNFLICIAVFAIYNIAIIASGFLFTSWIPLVLYAGLPALNAAFALCMAPITLATTWWQEFRNTTYEKSTNVVEIKIVAAEEKEEVEKIPIESKQNTQEKCEYRTCIDGQGQSPHSYKDIENPEPNILTRLWYCVASPVVTPAQHLEV